VGREDVVDDKRVLGIHYYLLVDDTVVDGWRLVPELVVVGVMEGEVVRDELDEGRDVVGLLEERLVKTPLAVSEAVEVSERVNERALERDRLREVVEGTLGTMPLEEEVEN
jgi:hypothetical protein